MHTEALASGAIPPFSCTRISATTEKSTAISAEAPSARSLRWIARPGAPDARGCLRGLRYGLALEAAAAVALYGIWRIIHLF